MRKKGYLSVKISGMYERKISENLDCGVNVANKIVGGKWRACIIDSIGRVFPGQVNYSARFPRHRRA